MAETSSTTLTDFLLARIAEDEAEVRHPDWCAAVRDDQACDCDGRARVLAECEAKRRIVNLPGQIQWAGVSIVSRLLALPYADHPNYREEWKP